uniref:Leucine-rich repeat-containing protein 58 n=1 Tax=Homalodisca liturata TaxID=320908 RepID=A0A1B6ICK5_9HEMI
MASSQSDNTNLKIGLIFVKSKVTENGVCLSSLSDTEVFPSGKRHEKWIVVAGNSYNISTEKDPKSWSSLDEEKRQSPRRLCQDEIGRPGGHFLDQPLLQSNIVEMHLDSVFKDKTAILSLELFKCVNVRVLSLRHNNLMSLPAEIGRLSHLRTLYLTENCLTYNTIPYTLTFCTELTELYLDHNLLDALPGFLLDMKQLETVYRHGNHNYFKCTFMWYHTADCDRVMPLRPNRTSSKKEGSLNQPQSLESLSIKSLIASKVNFFTPGLLPVTLQDYVAMVYTKYKICAFCSAAFDESKTGFRVFTFKNPYLGNTCVPFKHWTCSHKCGMALEEPAHRQERAQARQLELQYQQYIRSVQAQYHQGPPDKRGFRACVIM